MSKKKKGCLEEVVVRIIAAETVQDGVAVLAADPSARVLGGGTLAVRDYSSGDTSIGTFVTVDGLGLDQISLKAGRAEIGSAVTMAKILAHPGLSFLHPVAREIGGPAVRAMATIGGNLFAPAPYGDFAVALLALGAEVGAENGRKGETTGLEAFLKERARPSRAVVTHVSFPLPAEGTFRFLKVVRKHPHGASVLSIAALLALADGCVRGARVAYGAMAPTPIRTRAVEKALEGRQLDASAIADAVAVAGEGTSPASDSQASDWYRANVLPAHLARLLKR